MKLQSIALTLLFLAAAGCSPAATPLPPAPTSAPKDGAGLANPAAVYCQDKGYATEIRTAADGSQSGVCKFPDGSECDEWAFFRGECGPGTSVPRPPSATLPPAEPGGENKVVEITRAQLAEQLGVDPSAIQLVRLEAVTWPDACLDLATPGEVCAATQTPGFRVVLSTGDSEFSFHTDLTGSVVRAEASAATAYPSQP